MIGVHWSRSNEHGLSRTLDLGPTALAPRSLTICIIPHSPAAFANTLSPWGCANPAIPAGEMNTGKEVSSPIILHDVLQVSTSTIIRGRNRISLYDFRFNKRASLVSLFPDLSNLKKIRCLGCLKSVVLKVDAEGKETYWSRRSLLISYMPKLSPSSSVLPLPIGQRENIALSFHDPQPMACSTNHIQGYRYPRSLSSSAKRSMVVIYRGPTGLTARMNGTA